MDIKLPRTDENQEIIESAGLDYLDYDKRWSQYRIRVSAKDLTAKKETISLLLKTAYDLRQ